MLSFSFESSEGVKANFRWARHLCRAVTVSWKHIFQKFEIILKDEIKRFATHLVRASNSSWARRYLVSKLGEFRKFQEIRGSSTAVWDHCPGFVSRCNTTSHRSKHHWELIFFTRNFTEITFDTFHTYKKIRITQKMSQLRVSGTSIAQVEKSFPAHLKKTVSLGSKMQPNFFLRLFWCNLYFFVGMNCIESDSSEIPKEKHCFAWVFASMRVCVTKRILKNDRD